MIVGADLACCLVPTEAYEKVNCSIQMCLWSACTVVMSISLWQLRQLLSQVNDSYTVNPKIFAMTVGVFVVSICGLLAQLLTGDKAKEATWTKALINLLLFFAQVMLIVIFNRFVTMSSKYNQQRLVVSALTSEVTASEMVSNTVDSPRHSRIDMSDWGLTHELLPTELGLNNQQGRPSIRIALDKYQEAPIIQVLFTQEARRPQSCQI